MDVDKNNIELVRSYFAAVARGDMEQLKTLFAHDLKWHQPGAGSLSGTYEGTDALFGLLGSFMERSGGTFRIDEVGAILANGDYVATTLRFSATRAGASMAMSGIDVLRIKAGRICEVWLFSTEQAEEDKFWG